MGWKVMRSSTLPLRSFFFEQKKALRGLDGKI